MNAKGRLTQFETLVDACHNGGGEKETKPTDLEGFWDGIIVAQVEDIERDFQTLKAMESRGWNEAEPGLITNLNFLCFFTTYKSHFERLLMPVCAVKRCTRGVVPSASQKTLYWTNPRHQEVKKLDGH